MKERKDPAKGLIHPEENKGIIHHKRYLPSAELAHWIEHYWTVSWNFRELESYTAQTLSHPSIHITFETTKCCIHGPSEGRFSRQLIDIGSVFGVKFLPGAFYPWVRQPLSDLHKKEVRLEILFGEKHSLVEQAILQSSSTEEKIRCIEKYLMAVAPQPDQNLNVIKTLCRMIMENRSLLRVEDLSNASGLTIRQLQCLFREQVGWSPKWMIQRYRLHEILEQANSGQSIDWLSLAEQLGYFDQAHFIRDFRKLIGETPTEYINKVKRGNV
jgi:AraC-like DNA-binding protein